ncbi:hypothetical protein D9619_003804 [Psilocybe cf. subviscida]|uniref:Peptidase C14 caspase domain-containing protein n=1 Tax=Psilocybe cf. subviscida TaxID=2480587 RepID=A0A8H5AZG2_9AGAR|nr:hypothetical protein D9619_003804 [Psilocybe cf. subviscida]
MGDPSNQTPFANDYFAQNYGHDLLSPSSLQSPPTVAFPTPHISPSLQPPPRGMHFSYSEPTQVPTQRTLLKKPRPPKYSYSQSYSQVQEYSSSYAQPQAQAYQYYSASHNQPEAKPVKKHSHSHSNSKSSSRPPQLTYVPRPSAAAQHPAFEYSKCTGRRRALCIGINYLGQTNELRGCINDAKHVRDFLRKQGNYRSSEIMVLTDDAIDPRLHPTRANIIAAMRWLVRDACQNDALFLHYSGHGGQTPDLDGDEADGFDEVIYPLDFKAQGHITDDEMHEIMVSPLPHGCRLTALFDACHSGTVLDLPYIYSPHGRLKGAHVSPRWMQKKSTPADVISWSGCADEQTSADTFQGGVAVGAMSHAFISALKAQPVQTYQQLLTSVRHILHPRYSQKPQLGSSHHIDTNLQFIF